MRFSILNQGSERGYQVLNRKLQWRSLGFLRNIMPEFGLLPKEYNVRVHGAYNPAVYYGKKDIPLGEVKLGEFSQWLSRRSKHPADMFRACSRFMWRYKTTAAPYFHLTLSFALFRYISDYSEHKSHRHSKYH
ncbi:unnamed protein product [Trichobilharzia regenti]|nr:unnamed protein product [Trichobilharzia regenti]